MKIPFLNVEIFKSAEIKELKKKLKEISARPSLTPWEKPPTDFYALPPIYPIPLTQLYEIEKQSDILQLVITTLRTEIFRNGIEIKPNYVTKCPKCNTEYDYNAEYCEKCGAKTITPAEEGKKLFEKWLKRANENEQTLTDVLGQIEDDLNITDNAYLLFIREYGFLNNQPAISELKEIMRINPITISIIADRTGRLGYNDNGKEVKFCLRHRNKTQEGDFCKECGAPLQKACYVVRGIGNAKPLYYAKNEIVHISKYNPSLIYGYSPIYSIWNKVTTLINMDKYIHDYYGSQKPPKGVFFVNTKNPISFEKAWNDYIRKLQMHPTGIFPIVTNSDTSETAQFINFMNSLQEMQYIETRNEMRKIIGSLYGIMPLFHGDIDTASGLNVETQQITVTNRAIERGQRIYNEKIFPALARELGVDWHLELNPPEPEDELKELQTEQQKIQNALLMSQLGFDVELQPDGEFKFTKKENAEPQINPNEINIQNPDVFRKSLPAKNPIQTKEQRELKKKLEEKILEFLKKFKWKRISESTLKERAEKIIKALSNSLKNLTYTQLKHIYNKNIEEVENELNLDIGFSEPDREALDIIHKSKPFTEAYKNLDKALSNKVNKAIAEWYKNPTDLATLSKQISAIVKNNTGRIDTIIRTETGNISNLARYNSYKKVDTKGEYKYKWIGPNDSRTTDICKRISERTKNGVTLEELKKIIEEEADKSIYRKDRPFVPHLNCRHTFIRVAE